MPFALACEMSQHTIPLSEREPCRSASAGEAWPDPASQAASLDLWAALKCLCVARKFNSGLYNGIESPERSQRTTRHPGAPLALPRRAIPIGQFEFRIRRTSPRSAPAPASGIVDGAILQLRHCGNCALRRRGAHAAPGPWRVRSGVDGRWRRPRTSRVSAAPGCPCPGVDRAGGPAVSVTARRRVDRQSDAA